MGDEYKIEVIEEQEARYKRTGGLNVGVPRGVRVEDLEQGIIIISLNERSQLKNKEKCMDLLNAHKQSQQLKDENIELKAENKVLKVNINELLFAEAEAMALVLNHEGCIYRLKAEYEKLKAELT